MNRSIDTSLERSGSSQGQRQRQPGRCCGALRFLIPKCCKAIVGGGLRIGMLSECLLNCFSSSSRVSTQRKRERSGHFIACCLTNRGHAGLLTPSAITQPPPTATASRHPHRPCLAGPCCCGAIAPVVARSHLEQVESWECPPGAGSAGRAACARPTDRRID